MAVGTFTLYSRNKDDIRLNDILSATVKIALVSSAYTPDTATTGDDLWADVSANELANGNGYTTGGATLASVAVTAVSGGYKLTSANPSWTASGGNIPAWRYAVIYLSGTVWGQVNPLIGYFLGDTTPADVPATSSGNTLTITVPANGWFAAT
jgi:hypothetical protein